MKYNHIRVEKKWQKYWEENQVFKLDIDSKKEKYYVLDMFPYPSGQGLHVGHPEGYTATDIVARYKRMQGFEVLHPIGFDSFGLPAEQYAIQTNNSPREFTLKNIDNFTKQLKNLGFSFNWEKALITSEPYYYKHTQWIFAQLHKNNLTELKMIEVNWCPELNTVLSNEEVLKDDKGNMVSERGSFPVYKKEMKQWVLKITKYADKLFEGLEDLNWPSKIKKLQKNWIFNEGDPKEGLHLRDWIFARQRYWGEPFPIVHSDDGEIYLIPESKYPVELPKITDYTFSKDGQPSLAKAKDWVEYNDEVKGSMDTNTMPQWAASSWYYIAYILKEVDENGNDYILDLNSKKAKERLSKWLPVDLYIGGQEHAVLHLLYARFWHLFLKDIGIVSSKEPFQKLYNQGMILGETGEKMSKSKGNTISPDEIVEEYGADALRLYEMFMGPLADDKPWSMTGIKGIRNWIDRVYNLKEKVEIKDDSFHEENFDSFVVEVSNNIERLSFNNAISNMMVFINNIYKRGSISKKELEFFLQALSLFAPHLAEEMWNDYDFKHELLYAKWPDFKSMKVKQKINIALQEKGKLRKIIENYELLEGFPQGKTNIDALTQDQINTIKEIIVNTNINFDSIKMIIFVKDKILNLI